LPPAAFYRLGDRRPAAICLLDHTARVTTYSLTTAANTARFWGVQRVLCCCAFTHYCGSTPAATGSFTHLLPSFTVHAPRTAGYTIPPLHTPLPHLSVIHLPPSPVASYTYRGCPPLLRVLGSQSTRWLLLRARGFATTAPPGTVLTLHTVRLPPPSAWRTACCAQTSLPVPACYCTVYDTVHAMRSYLDGTIRSLIHPTTIRCLRLPLFCAWWTTARGLAAFTLPALFAGSVLRLPSFYCGGYCLRLLLLPFPPPLLYWLAAGYTHLRAIPLAALRATSASFTGSPRVLGSPLLQNMDLGLRLRAVLLCGTLPRVHVCTHTFYVHWFYCRFICLDILATSFKTGSTPPSFC